MTSGPPGNPGVDRQRQLRVDDDLLRGEFDAPPLEQQRQVRTLADGRHSLWHTFGRRRVDGRDRINKDQRLAATHYELVDRVLCRGRQVLRLYDP